MTDPRQDYLAAYRRSVDSPPGVRDDNLRAVLDRASAGEREHAQPSRWAAAVLGLKITSVAVVGAGLGWAGVRAASDAPADHVASTAQVHEDPAPAAAPPMVAEPAPAVVPTPAPAKETLRAAASPSPRRASKPTDAVADELREELALLEAAQAHLRAGRHAEAAASLREHARRFPQGALSTERSAWRAIVACSGSGPQPKAAARSFILTHGDTPLAAKVKAECEL